MDPMEPGKNQEPVAKLARVVDESEVAGVPSNAARCASILDGYRDAGRLTMESILAALQELSDRMGEKGEHGTILLLGGAAMILMFQNREGTKDIDAIIEPKNLIHAIAIQMAEDHGLPEGWLNDAAKGFMPSNSTYGPEGVPQFPNLTVLAPTPTMLFAMKAMATRIDNVPGEDEPRDINDLRVLAKAIGIRGREDAARVIEPYYPMARVPMRFWYALDELLGEEGES